jgi:signal transduction histidine kinase
LLAESTQSIVNLVRWICEVEGFEIEVVSDAATLLELIDRQSFDIICITQGIDDDNGLTTLRSIRSDERFRYTPIFLFSATPKQSHIQQALAAGATDLIPKSEFENLSYFLARYKDRLKSLNGKVLLVEDSPSQQAILKSILHSIGCSVDVFDCVDEAFESYASCEYDLVVTDIVLKGYSSGVALAGKIRRFAGVKGDIPILAVTGYDDPAREVSLFSYGVTDYIRKPVRERPFLRQVKTLIESYQHHKKVERKSNELIRSDKQRIQFWAELSHELRTPLNGVIGALQLLQVEDVSPDKRDFLSVAKNSSEMLMSLLNDVLDLTKAETGKLHYTIRTVDLKNTIQQQIDTVKNLAKEKNIAIETSIGEQVPGTVGCDSTRLNQVVINLLHNAIKFTDEGSVKLNCILDSKHSNILRFSISDTGAGISDSDQKNIFVKYKQANKEIESERGGTGLGLHIAKLIVSMWGGEIGVNSTLGKGSEFWFTLPFKEVQDNQRMTQVEVEFSNPENKRVLVVDDCEVNRMITKGLLEVCEVVADSASGAEESIQKLKITDYDFVFMDFEMPGFNGLETTKMIRELGGNLRDIPIVALTGTSMEEKNPRFLTPE